MIREIQISAAASNEDDFYEPPSTLLVLAMIGEEAFMRVHSCGEKGQPSAEPLCAFQVKARSLLLALQAAIEDEQSPDT